MKNSTIAFYRIKILHHTEQNRKKKQLTKNNKCLIKKQIEKKKWLVEIKLLQKLTIVYNN